MTVDKGNRAYVHEEYLTSDDDTITPEEARKWLQEDMGYDGDIDSLLDEIFKDGKVYHHATDFIQDIENLLAELRHTHNTQDDADINSLSPEELNILEAELSSENKDSDIEDTGDSTSKESKGNRAYIHEKYLTSENDTITREEATQWLQEDMDYDGDINLLLNKIFTEGKSYHHATDFVKDIEKLLAELSHTYNMQDDDDIYSLSFEELNTLETELSSENKDSDKEDTGDSASHEKHTPKSGRSSKVTKGSDKEDTGDSASHEKHTPKSGRSSKETKVINDSGVSIVGLTSTPDNSDTLDYPEGIQEGDNAVLVLSYSTDHTHIDIDKLKSEGWQIEFKKGATNGKNEFSDDDGDLVTLVATKKMSGDESGDSYTIPTIGGKNDVSAQMTVISGGNIDISKMTSNAEDGESGETLFEDNDTVDAPLFLYVASADDPADYSIDNLDGLSDVTHFGAARHGDDAGATFVSSNGDGGSIDFNYEGGGGRNDHSLTIPIVLKQ